MPYCVDQIQAKTEMEELRHEFQAALEAERHQRRRLLEDQHRLFDARMNLVEEELRRYRRLFAVIRPDELAVFEARALASEVARDGGSGPGTVRSTF